MSLPESYGYFDVYSINLALFLADETHLALFFICNYRAFQFFVPSIDVEGADIVAAFAANAFLVINVDDHG